jgi:hypothetical protein
MAQVSHSKGGPEARSHLTPLGGILARSDHPAASAHPGQRSWSSPGWRCSDPEVNPTGLARNQQSALRPPGCMGVPLRKQWERGPP